jgi:hypothetical protein
MATAAQIAANRRNALRGTGPRTAAGKAVSSRNALRHGLTARATVVLDEDAQDFQRLRAELWTELAPRDDREELLVETVVQAAWRMRRAWRAEARLFNRAGRLDPVFSQPRELLTVIRHEASANRAFHRGLALLERGRSAAEPPGRRGGRPSGPEQSYTRKEPNFRTPRIVPQGRRSPRPRRAGGSKQSYTRKEPNFGTSRTIPQGRRPPSPRPHASCSRVGVAARGMMAPGYCTTAAARP